MRISDSTAFRRGPSQERLNVSGPVVFESLETRLLLDASLPLLATAAFPPCGDTDAGCAGIMADAALLAPALTEAQSVENQDDGYEDNDTFFTAVAIGEGTINDLRSYDADFFMVDLSPGDLLVTHIEAGLAHFIYDPNHLLRAGSVSSESGKVAQWIADTEGWHRIVVPDQEPEDYSLAVDVESPPPPPQDVHASDGAYSTKVCVTWNSLVEDAYFEVWRSTTEDFGSATPLAMWLTATSLDDTSVVQGQTYYYWVKAKRYLAAKIIGESEFGADSGYATIDDDHEENDSFDEAAVIAEGSVAGLMSYDADYYRIELWTSATCCIRPSRRGCPTPYSIPREASARAAPRAVPGSPLSGRP